MQDYSNVFKIKENLVKDAYYIIYLYVSMGITHTHIFSCFMGT